MFVPTLETIRKAMAAFPASRSKESVFTNNISI